MFHRHLLCQVVKQLLPLLHKNNILIKSNILLTYQPLRDFRWFQSDLWPQKKHSNSSPWVSTTQLQMSTYVKWTLNK